MNLKSRKIIGSLTLGIGLVLIFLCFVFKSMNFNIFNIGFYVSPLIIIAGAIILISHKEN